MSKVRRSLRPCIIAKTGLMKLNAQKSSHYNFQASLCGADAPSCNGVEDMQKWRNVILQHFRYASSAKMQVI